MPSSNDRAGSRLVHTRGFSILELLTVVAILATLGGILLPSLASVRGMAWQAGSNAMQRQLVMGLLAYGSANDEWIPGVNTSGLRLWDANGSARIYAGLSRRPDAPVQNTDWMSPALGGSPLPRSRDQRFFTLLERFADPAMPLRVPVFANRRPGSRELTEWIERHASEPARGVSFLMPMNFQLAAGEHLRAGRSGPWVQVGQRRYAGGLLQRQTLHPSNYVPRMTRVGTASQKIAFADGFRYLDATSGALDFDAAYSPYRWGSFAGRSPVDQLSRSWGRRGGGGDGANLPLVYRHFGKLDAAFWDGHVQMLSPRESRNPRLWAPSGSVFVGQVDTDPDSLGFGIKPLGDTRSAPTASNRIP